MSGLAIVAILALVVFCGLALVERQYRHRPGNDLELSGGAWHLDRSQPDHYRLVGKLELRNRTRRLEIMVPQVEAQVKLLSSASLDGTITRAQVTPQHPDAEARPDGYWFGYIVKIGKSTGLEVAIDIQGDRLDQLKTAWVQVHYVTYGPEGRIPKTRHVIVPLKFPDPDAPERWRSTQAGAVMPVYTHLLTHLDDPVAIVKRYVLPHAKPGDVVTIGETPVAIMQGRWRHPQDVKPGWLAKRLCYYFMPTSSLATACGMQTLVDIVGTWRVLSAFLIGAIAKILGKPGVFYQLAGEQARLIDDVTGTLPPYDQFIVLGPDRPQQVVDQIERETGILAAIVDVNDLRAVKVLAGSPAIPAGLLEQALLSNPAGNADEQTPIVLIRPSH